MSVYKFKTKSQGVTRLGFTVNKITEILAVLDVLWKKSNKFKIGNFQPIFGKILTIFCIGTGAEIRHKNGLEKSLLIRINS